MADYSSIAQEMADEDRSRVRSSVFGAAEANPDQAARAKALGQRVGVPQDVAERNLNEIERRVLAGDIDEATRDTPAARRFYGTPYGAKVGKDDVETLTEMERTFQRRLQTGQAVQGKIGEKLYGVRGTVEETERSTVGGVVEPVQRGLARGAQGLGLLMGELGVFGGLQQQQADAATRGGVSYSPEVERAARYADQQRQIERFPVPPEIADALAQITTSSTAGEALGNIARNPRAVLEVVLESLGTSAPALAAAVTGSAVGPGGTAAGAGAGSFAVEYSATLSEVMAERGLSMTDPNNVRAMLSDPALMAAAREKAVKRAIPIAAFDAITAGLAGRLLAAARAGSASAVKIGAAAVGEAGLQAVGGGAGEAAAQAATGEWNWGEILLEAMAEIPSAVIEVPSNFRNTLRDAQAAEARTQFVENLNKLAAASKVAQRDPDSFEQFVAQAAENGPVTEVYVDAQTLAQLGLAEKLAEVSPSVGQQFTQALAAGGDVVIPVSEYAARIAPTDLAQGLLDHLRTAPDEMSRAEAQEFLQQAPQQFEKELERVTGQAADAMASQLSREAVKEKILTDLTAANRFTADVNETYATVASTVFATMAARVGVTPEQMYERFALRTQAANPTGDLVGQESPREFQQGGVPLREVPFTDKKGANLTLRLSKQTFGANAMMPNAVLVEAYEGGQRRGFIDFEITPDGKLASGFTRVADAYQRRGIAQAMYQAAIDAGYEIVPGRAQTETGAKMLATLQERGLVSREQEQFNQQEAQDGRPEQAGDGGGGYSAGGLAPLPGAPNVAGASGPDPRLVAVAEQYARSIGVDLRRPAEYVQVDPERAARIAAAYEAMPHAPQDPAVQEAYQNLIAQTVAQYRALEAAGYKFYFFDESNDPYAGNPWNAMRDLRANQAMGVFATAAGFGSGATLNVGLASPTGGADLTSEQVLQAITEVGGEVEANAVHASDTEPTAVVKLKAPLTTEQANTLAEMLGQEAIAQRLDDGSGDLFGPGAENWGAFSNDFFFTLDGQRASSVMNPLLADTGITWPYGPNGEPKRVLANDLFRAVHDAFGHGLEGAGFRAQGEENAWQAHVRLFTGSAVGAITTETRGQNSWLNYGPYGERNRNASVEDTVFADQKTGLMPEWTWTEGRVADMDDGTQAEQRRLRQDMDLSILQQAAGGDTLQQSAPRVEQTETPSFKAWFGDSKVVDESGKPLVVYHGGARGITEFDPGAVGSNFGYDTEGFFFTTERGNRPGTADNYAGPDGEVYPVYLALQRPYTLEQFATDLRLTVDGLVMQEGSPQSPITVFDTDRAEIMRRVRGGGYDGVAFDVDYGDGTREAMYVALQPTQIKSAIGNQGTFDPNDANILRQDAKPGETSVTGLHFSRQVRSRLNGGFYGTGLQGAERDRVFSSDDTRLRSRVYFYVDEGNGVVPEAGVGGAAHSAELTNLYDINADPLKLASQGGGINAIETRILDAGFDGYYRASFANNAGVAVVIGPASRSIPVTPIENPNVGTGGYTAPEPTVRVQLSPEQVAGLDEGALRAAAPNATLERSFIAVRPSFVSLPESELDAARPLMSSLGVTLPSPRAALAQNEGARGTFSPSRMTITLLEKADLSTFLHEMGHFYLEMLAGVASQPGAPADVVADMNKVLEWFGVKDVDTWRAMPLDQQRKYHEKFAESFEQYLIEGKAPSKDLQPLFARFRAWMLNVYQSLRQFLARHNTDLTDEVRGVFDRMLATQAEIDELQATRGMLPLFASAEEAGMTPEEWARYQQAIEQADEEAIAALQSRSLRDLRWTARTLSGELKKIAKDVAAKRKAVEAEVTAEVDATPEMQAKAVLDGMKAEERTPAAMDVVAERFGYDSGDAMLRAIDAYGKRADAIQGITDQRMLERYGDLTTLAGQRRAAEEAVHNEARARMVATELKTLAGATNVRADTGKADKRGRAMIENVMLRAAKQFAAVLVARKKIKDLKPAQHTAAESRAAKRAAQAVAAGKTQDAITAKRDQLLNFHAAKETMAAQEEVEKGLKYLAKTADSESLSPDYREQIDALLERFDLRRSTTNREAARRVALLQWVEAQREMGVEPNIPPELLVEANRKPYREMTVEEFRGLVDMVKQIAHLGRLKNQLLTAKRQRVFTAARDEMVDSILANADGRRADTRTPNTVLGGALLGMKRFWAAHIKAATWARVMDGGKDGGPVWEYLIRSANDAGDWEIDRRAQATREIANLLAPVLKLGPMGGKGVFIPEIGRSMNREARLAVALNTGNASNMQRLMGGEGWNAGQVQAITRTLSEPEWRFVQKVWDYFESFRPEIAAKEKRVNGVEPEWVEVNGITVETADGKTLNLRGGYYPVKYDPRASERAEAHLDAEAARQQMQGAYTSTTTRRSFTKTRADEVVGRPLLYSLDGIYNGINEVIHDLAWHEFLIDANRLVRDQKLAAAMRQTYGPESHQQFKTWLQDVAVGDRGAQNAGESALAWLRQGVSVAGLGFNVMTALIQPLGLTQSIVRVGPKYVARGVARFIGSPLSSVDEINEKSSFMRNRMKTRFRELAEVRAQVKGQTKARRAVDTGAYWLMLRAQQTVDVPTWIGAYEKAITEGNAEERAIALADQAVIDSQGGGTMKDLSSIERGSPALKLFTVFYSFFNAALNLGVAQTMTEQSKARLAAQYLLLFVIPAILGEALKAALTPGDSGDWDDPEEIAKKMVAAEISYLTGLMVGLREIGPALQTAAGVNDFPMGYQGPSGLRLITDTYKLAAQAGQGEADDGLRKAIINLAGSLLRLPAAQINRSITGAQALSDGETDNPAAVVFGYQEPN